ncbi:MAG: hypothetical protein JWP92_1391 [Caulobacter sp.]|nr:hypothetical protein [Caulobacter sp.]
MAATPRSVAASSHKGVAMILARASRPAPSPPPPAVVVSLAEFRLAQSQRALAASRADPPEQRFPWAYVFEAPRP